jgi:hypothetical protein
MKKPLILHTDRFTLRLPHDIMVALDELLAKRYARIDGDQRYQFSMITITDLLIEAALLLLKREKVPVGPAGRDGAKSQKKRAK